jgi:hypothetical protein
VYTPSNASDVIMTNAPLWASGRLIYHVLFFPAVFVVLKRGFLLRGKNVS